MWLHYLCLSAVICISALQDLFLHCSMVCILKWPLGHLVVVPFVMKVPEIRFGHQTISLSNLSMTDKNLKSSSQTWHWSAGGALLSGSPASSLKFFWIHVIHQMWSAFGGFDQMNSIKVIWSYKHYVEMCWPMCEIQEVARTQSVQSITGNSPLSISCQIFVSIWFLDAWFQCQKIFQLSPFSRVFILISKCELSHFISWLNLKWSQIKTSLVAQQKHFIDH